MDTKITLRAARYNAGLTLREAAKAFGIDKDRLTRFERDSTDIPRSILMMIPEIYSYPIDNIFFGIESDFIRIRQKSFDPAIR